MPDDGARGPAKFQEIFGIWQTAFPDWHMTIEQVVCEGDLVVTRRRSTGTQEGPLFGLEPTGKGMDVEATDVHRVVDGLVVESWIADDVPRIMLQLGVITPLPMAAPPAAGALS